MYDPKMTLKFTQYDDGEPEEITLNVDVSEFILYPAKNETRFTLRGIIGKARKENADRQQESTEQLELGVIENG